MSIKNEQYYKNIPVVDFRKCVAEMYKQNYMPSVFVDWPPSALMCWLYKDTKHTEEGFYPYKFVEESFDSEVSDFRVEFENFLSFVLNISNTKKDAEYDILIKY